MHLKTFLLVAILAGIIAGAAFGQTMQISGTVTAVTRTQITLQSGSTTWTVARTSATSVTGSLTPGANVTIQCAAPDAHKNENPTLTPSPAAD